MVSDFIMEFRRLRSTFLLLACAALAGACSKETTPAPEPKGGEPAAPGARTEVTPASVNATDDDSPSELAKARFDEANFDLKIAPKGSYKVGQASEAVVELQAKKPFKPNDKYPYKLTLQKSDGVKFPADTVKKDAAKLDGQRVTMTVPFTPESAGKKKIAGKFSFSVCTDDKCLIEKRDLALDITVE